jgi:hypothetical protein
MHPTISLGLFVKSNWFRKQRLQIHHLQMLISWFWKTISLSLGVLALVHWKLFNVQAFHISCDLSVYKSSITLRVCWQRKRSLYCFAMQKDRLHTVASKLSLVRFLIIGHRQYLALTAPLSKACNCSVLRFYVLNGFCSDLCDCVAEGRPKA